MKSTSINSMFNSIKHASKLSYHSVLIHFVTYILTHFVTYILIISLLIF